MSLSIVASALHAGSRARAGLPVVPSWTLPREGLNERLDLGVGGVVTVVSAPTGAGKTLGVASWAAGPTSPPGLVWLNLARGGAEPDRVWRLLRRGLHEAGERRLPPVPKSPASAAVRIRALVELGEALRDREPWTVVLDGYPTGTPATLGSELEIVAGPRWTGPPPDRDVPGGPRPRPAPVLGGRGADAGERWGPGDGRWRDPGGASAREQCFGRARRGRGLGPHLRLGVRRSACGRGAGHGHGRDVRHAGDRPRSRGLPGPRGPGCDDTPGPPSLVWTSVVEVVPPGVVRAVLGPDTRIAIDRTIDSTGLVPPVP